MNNLICFGLTLLLVSCGSNEDNDSSPLVAEVNNVEFDYELAVDSFNRCKLKLADEDQRNVNVDLFNNIIEKYPQSAEADSSKMYLDSIEIYKIKADKIKDEKLLNVIKPLRVEYDKFEEYTWYYDKSTPNYSNKNYMYLYVGLSGGEGDYSGTPNLRVKIQYTADDWLFIKKYTILTDDEKYTLVPANEELKSDVFGGGKIYENFDQKVNSYNLSMYEDIAKSEEVEIKFDGNQYYDTRKLTEKEKSGIQKVLDFYNVLIGD